MSTRSRCTTRGSWFAAATPPKTALAPSPAHTVSAPSPNDAASPGEPPKLIELTPAPSIPTQVYEPIEGAAEDGSDEREINLRSVVQLEMQEAISGAVAR